jgi:hypothetical protein
MGWLDDEERCRAGRCRNARFMPELVETRAALSKALEDVRFSMHVKCPLLLLLALWGCG